MGIDWGSVPEINVAMEGGRTVGAQRTELRTLLRESEGWEGFLVEGTLELILGGC